MLLMHSYPKGDGVWGDNFCLCPAPSTGAGGFLLGLGSTKRGAHGRVGVLGLGFPLLGWLLVGESLSCQSSGDSSAPAWGVVGPAEPQLVLARIVVGRGHRGHQWRPGAAVSPS